MDETNEIEIDREALVQAFVAGPVHTPVLPHPVTVQATKPSGNTSQSDKNFGRL